MTAGSNPVLTANKLIISFGNPNLIDYLCLMENDLMYMNEILDYLDKMKDQHIEFGHDDRIALDLAYRDVKSKYGKLTYRKFVNWIETR